MIKLFTRHPRDFGETYLQHFKFAIGCGICMIVGGIACIIHSIFPFLFKHTGSNITFYLARKLSNKIQNERVNS